MAAASLGRPGRGPAPWGLGGLDPLTGATPPSLPPCAPQVGLAIAILVLFGLQQQSAFYFEAALLLALLGFVGTVALCKYLLRGDIIE